MEPQIQYECFSSESQLIGNALTKALTVVLVPYEGLNVDTSKDMCYLLSETSAVLTVIYPGGIQFSQTFLYQYDKQINVTIPIPNSQSFTDLMEIDSAMYKVVFKSQNELSGSFKSVQYLLKDTSSCFASIVFQFNLRSSFVFDVKPNECQIDMSKVNVYIPFLYEGKQLQLPMYPCIPNPKLTPSCVS